jgi:hypothetical protein
MSRIYGQWFQRFLSSRRMREAALLSGDRFEGRGMENPIELCFFRRTDRLVRVGRRSEPTTSLKHSEISASSSRCRAAAGRRQGGSQCARILARATVTTNS